MSNPFAIVMLAMGAGVVGAWSLDLIERGLRALVNRLREGNGETRRVRALRSLRPVERNDEGWMPRAETRRGR